MPGETVMARVLQVLDADPENAALAAEVRALLSEVDRLMDGSHAVRIVEQADRGDAWTQHQIAHTKNGLIDRYEQTRYVHIPDDAHGFLVVDALTPQNAGLIADGPRWIRSLAMRMSRVVELLAR